MGSLTLQLLRCVLVVFVAALSTSASEAEVVSGQSRELGIRFEVKGGSDWCSSSALVRLDAENATAFRSADVPFQQMIGRIRAVVMGQCSILDGLTFEGYSKGSLAFVAEVSKLTGWRHLVSMDAATRRPHCLFGLQVHAECARRAQAYMVGRQALQPILYPDLVFTTLLDPRAPTHFAWKAGDVVGKLTIAEGDPVADGSDGSNAAAAGVLIDLVEGCKANEGTPGETWLLDGAKEVTLGGFDCQRAAARENIVVVVAGTAAGFDVFSLSAAKGDPEAANQMGWGIALAIKDRGW